MSERHTQNDCCIGNDQQFLDALTVGSNKNNLIACTIDLMDAFFLVILEKKKQHPSAADVFLPLEEMMRLKLHDSLTPTLQTRVNVIWNANFKGSIESLKVGTTSQKCRPTHFRVCRSLKVYSLK